MQSCGSVEVSHGKIRVRPMDASVNIQRKQKTLEAFGRLPDEFTIEDVVRCFNLGSTASARKKVTRLYRDHLIKKVSEEKGGEKALFQKTGTIML